MEQSEHFWTVEEYLAYEQETGIKHEYIDGEIFAMSGGTNKHSRIKANCMVEIGYQLRGQRCLLYDNDMKVKISDIKFVYPDLSVVCNKPVFADESETILTNPTLVAEVTSPSSASLDKGTKADFYRGLPSVQTYLITDQEKPYAQLYTRQGKGWFLQTFDSLDEGIELDSIGCKLPMSEIYRDIEYATDDN